MMRVGLVGARGHVGGELIALLAAHPEMELAFAASRQGVGEAVAGAPGLTMEELTPAPVAGATLIAADARDESTRSATAMPPKPNCPPARAT